MENEAGIFETFTKRARASVANIGVALTCALPGATQAMEAPVLDAIDTVSMIRGSSVASDENRAGVLTNLARSAGADDTQFNGKGELEDACAGGKFVGATVAGLVAGGVVAKGTKFGLGKVRGWLTDRAKEEFKHQKPIATGIGAVLRTGARNATVGILVPATVGAGVAVAKDVYRVEHPMPEAP